MDNAERTILIIEDDELFLNALTEVFQRANYKVVGCRTGKEAISQASFRQIHLAIIDCMLPKINGVDAVHELRAMGFEDIPVYLMSGIFRDRGFAADAKKKTGAIDYLFKPFDVDKLVKEVDAHFSKSKFDEVDDVHMSSFLTSNMDSADERKSAFERIDVMSGFDLPFAISILMDGESTGTLTAVTESGIIYKMQFNEGRLYNLEAEDTIQQTLNLLVQKGHLLKEDLSEIDYSKMKPNNLLDNLVDKSYLSPHLIGIVRTEYMLATIKKMVTSEKYEVCFVQEKLDDINFSLQSSLFVPLIHEMIDEGLDLDWLKSFYQPWFEIPMVKGPRFSMTHQVLYTPLLASLQGIEQCLGHAMSINTILATKSYKEAELLKGIHLMAIQRLISFDPSKANSADTQDMNRLINLKEQLANKNAIEIFKFFGAGPMGSVPEVERIYKEVAKVHHPDKLPNGASPEKIELVKEVFTQITTAYDMLTNPEKRSEFDKHLRQKDAEKQLKAEAILEDGMKELKKGKFGDAVILLEIANEMYPMPLAELYTVWAKLKQYQDELAPDSLMQQAEKLIETYPADMRTGPELNHVQGLYSLAKGDPEAAENFFARALTKDSGFIESRRELSAIKTDSKNNSSISEMLTGDLSVVISGLFNRKKSS